MKTQKTAVCLFLVLLFVASVSIAQENGESIFSRRLQNGFHFYQTEHFYQAAAEFRRAQENAGNSNEWAQALYWVILSELAYTDYGSALADMDELESRYPNSPYARDMIYHRARAYFNLGYFDDALLLFRRYIDSISHDETVSYDRAAAAVFWMGECLFTMGQFDEAERFYTWVIDQYPESPRYEVSAYRIDLIKQKKIEAELLALLQWSHEESLRTSEENKRKIRIYENTLNQYQRRITELTQGTGSVQIPPQTLPPVQPLQSQQPVPEVSQIIEPAAELQSRQTVNISPVPAQNTARVQNEQIEARARQLRNELQRLINEFDSAVIENGGGGK